jgi:hypothetical protein
VSLVFSGGKLVDGDRSGAQPQCFYRATMSDDDYGLPTHDVIEKLGKVSLGLRGSNSRIAGNLELPKA